MTSKKIKSIDELRTYINETLTKNITSYVNDYEGKNTLQTIINEAVTSLVGNTLGLRKQYGRWEIRNATKFQDDITKAAINSSKNIIKNYDFTLTENENKQLIKTIRNVYIEQLTEEARQCAYALAKEQVTKFQKDWLKEAGINIEIEDE